MEAYWVWWLAALVLLIAEMLTGTFYLLAVAFSIAVAGITAFLGISWEAQTAIAAVLCTISVAGIYRYRRKAPQSVAQPNLVYDIGQTVQVVSWLDERHARVQYRGAEWDAELAAQTAPDSKRKVWKIHELVGNRLIIE